MRDVVLFFFFFETRSQNYEHELRKKESAIAEGSAARNFPDGRKRKTHFRLMYTPLSLLCSAGQLEMRGRLQLIRQVTRCARLAESFFFFLSSLFSFNVDVITTTDNNNNNSNRFEAYKHKGEQLLGF